MKGKGKPARAQKHPAPSKKAPARKPYNQLRPGKMYDGTAK